MFFNVKIFFVLCLYSILFSGCILPIPHKRLSQPALDGIVVDCNTFRPVSNAVVSVSFDNDVVETTTTDDLGRWEILEKHTWHGAFLFAIPMSYSIFPFGYLPSFPIKINIEAKGYVTFSTPDVYYTLIKFSKTGIPLTPRSEDKTETQKENRNTIRQNEIQLSPQRDFFFSVITNPNSEIYYAGNIEKISCFVQQIGNDILFWNIENANIDPSIIFPFTKNNESWKLLKSKNDKKLSFWDKDKEIKDFINWLPIETAIVEKFNEWYKESSKTSEKNLTHYESFTIIETLYPNFKTKDEIVISSHCATAPINLKFDKDRGVFYNPEFRIAERDLYIINWKDTEFKVKNNNSVIYMSDNSLIIPLSFYWYLYSANAIDFDESLALSLYQKSVESMLPNDSH